MIGNNLLGPRSVDHVVEVSDFIELDCFDLLQFIVRAELVSTQSNPVTLSHGMVNLALYGIRGLEHDV